ncbi:MAG: hypothetical protein EOP06_32290, partial [Proteobacteria bacterium]
MANFICPSVYETADIPTFFREFVRLNENDPEFSFRNFAKAIRWPLGYLSDLVKGRRSLTLARCMQFIDFSNMDPITAERFLFLCMKDNLSEKQRELVDQKMPTSIGSNRFGEPSLLKPTREQTTLLVFSILTWAQRMLSHSEIMALTPMFELDPLAIDLALKTLTDSNVIQISGEGRLELLRKHMMLDELHSNDAMDVHVQFARSALAYYEHR